MIQQQGVCNSSQVLHKSRNLLVPFAVLWQKLQSLLCVPLRQALVEMTQIDRTQQFIIEAPEYLPSCKLEHGEPQGLWLGKGHTQSQAHITEYPATI